MFEDELEADYNITDGPGLDKFVASIKSHQGMPETVTLTIICDGTKTKVRVVIDSLKRNQDLASEFNFCFEGSIHQPAEKLHGRILEGLYNPQADGKYIGWLFIKSASEQGN